jgi:hypothetical protein
MLLSMPKSRLNRRDFLRKKRMKRGRRQKRKVERQRKRKRKLRSLSLLLKEFLPRTLMLPTLTMTSSQQS